MVRDQQTSISDYLTHPRTSAAYRSASGGGPSSPIPAINPRKQPGSSSPAGVTPRKRTRGGSGGGCSSDSSGVSVERLDRIQLESERTRIDADDVKPGPSSGRAVEVKKRRRIVDSDEEEDENCVYGTGQEDSDAESDPIEDTPVSIDQPMTIESESEEADRQDRTVPSTTARKSQPDRAAKRPDSQEVISIDDSTSHSDNAGPAGKHSKELIGNASDQNGNRDSSSLVASASTKAITTGSTMDVTKKRGAGTARRGRNWVAAGGSQSRTTAASSSGTSRMTRSKAAVASALEPQQRSNRIQRDVARAEPDRQGGGTNYKASSVVKATSAPTRVIRGTSGPSGVIPEESQRGPDDPPAPPPLKIFDSSDDDPKLQTAKAHGKGKAKEDGARSLNSGSDSDSDSDSDALPKLTRSRNTRTADFITRSKTGRSPGYHQPAARRKGATAGREHLTSSDEDDSDSEVETSDSSRDSSDDRRGGGQARIADRETGGRRRSKGKGKLDPDDEEDDLNPEALLSEIEMDEPVKVKSRLRARGKMTDFQRNLEIMKKKKLGKAARMSSPPEPVDVGHSEEDAWTVRSLTDEEDWIAEDPEDNFDSNDLPANYRMSAHQSLEHQFKIVIQYFVGLAVVGDDYVEQSETSYFKQPFDTVRRKLQGIKDSAITSSVWPTKFKTALETFPDFDCELLDEAVAGCDACHIGGRMSKYLGRLSGRPYDPDTFGDLSESEDEDDVSEGKEVNFRGPYKLERTIFLSIEKLYAEVSRGARAGTFRKDVSSPDDVLEHLEKRGKVRDEWERFSRMMYRAQHLEASGARRYGGED